MGYFIQRIRLGRFLSAAILAELLLAAFVSVAVAQSQPVVGALGDVSAIIFDGCKQCPPEQLRRELAFDIEVQIASAPTASLSDFVLVLQRRLQAGYLHSGFRTARLSVHLDEAHHAILVKVEEGPRSRQGEIQVKGVRTVPVEGLVRRLSTAHISGVFTGALNPSDGSLRIAPEKPSDDLPKTDWKPGEVAHFDVDALTTMTGKVQVALAELGYFHPKFTIDVVVPEADPTKATLLIDVADEGQRAMLGGIEVIGLLRNSPDALLDCAGLHKGDPVDLQKLQSAQLNLWESARLRKQILTARLQPNVPDKLLVRLELEEFAEAPLLGDSFTPTEQILLKTRQWFLGLRESDQDFVLAFTMNVIGELRKPLMGELILSPRSGSLVRLHGHGVEDGAQSEHPSSEARLPSARAASSPASQPAIDEASAGPTRSENGEGSGTQSTSKPSDEEIVSAWAKFDASAVFARQKIGVYVPPHRRKLTVGASGTDRRILIDASYLSEIQESGKTDWVLHLSAGGQAHSSAQHPPVELRLNLAPVAFVYLAHHPAMKYEMDGRVLRLTGNGIRCEIDAHSGEVISWDGVFGGSPTSVRVVKHALEQKLAELEQQVPGPGDYDQRSADGSMIRFFATEWLRIPLLRRDLSEAAREQAADAVGKLLSPGLFAVIDQIQAKASGLPDDAFNIPFDPSFQSRKSLIGNWALAGLPWCDDLFPRGSWPWTVSREMLLVWGERPDRSAAEMTRIYNSADTGPVGFMVCADLLSRADREVALAFAGKGLRSLTAEGFSKDTRVLFDGDFPLPRIAAGLVKNLRSLNDQEVEAVAKLLTPGQAELFRRIAAAVRQENDPVDLTKVLSRFWDPGLRQVVEPRLREIQQSQADKR